MNTCLEGLTCLNPSVKDHGSKRDESLVHSRGEVVEFERSKGWCVKLKSPIRRQKFAGSSLLSMGASSCFQKSCLSREAGGA